MMLERLGPPWRPHTSARALLDGELGGAGAPVVVIVAAAAGGAWSGVLLSLSRRKAGRGALPLAHAVVGVGDAGPHAAFWLRTPPGVRAASLALGPRTLRECGRRLTTQPLAGARGCVCVPPAIRGVPPAVRVSR